MSPAGTGSAAAGSMPCTYQANCRTTARRLACQAAARPGPGGRERQRPGDGDAGGPAGLQAVQERPEQPLVVRRAGSPGRGARTGSRGPPRAARRSSCLPRPGPGDGTKRGDVGPGVDSGRLRAGVAQQLAGLGEPAAGCEHPARRGVPEPVRGARARDPGARPARGRRRLPPPRPSAARAERPGPGTPAGAPSRPGARGAGTWPAARRRRPARAPDPGGSPCRARSAPPDRQSMSSSSSAATSPARSASRSINATIGSFRTPAGPLARTAASRSPAWPGLSPLGGAAQAGAAKEPTAPASADAVRPSCHMKPSRARRRVGPHLRRARAQPGGSCARRTARPAWRSARTTGQASACAATNGRTWNR